MRSGCANSNRLRARQGRLGAVSMKLSRAMQHTPLVWSDALSLAMPVMDTTHEEFVELLAKAAH